MKNIFIIAQNTFKELLRNRVLYSFIFFALFLMLLMMALGQLSFTEQFRLTLSLGLSSIHLCLVGLTLFVGGSIVYREIDRLTILTVLARPIRRSEFLFGKYFGFLELVLVFIAGFYVIYVGNMFIMGFEFSYLDLLLVFIGMALEITILLAITIFFSTFCASFLAIIFSLCLFLIGHWSESLSQLIANSNNENYLKIAKMAHKILPDLEIYNWRLYPIEHNIDSHFIFLGLLIALFWSAGFMFFATMIFSKRDFA